MAKKAVSYLKRMPIPTKRNRSNGEKRKVGNGIRGSSGLNPKLEIWEKIGVVRVCSGRLFGSILGLFAARSGHLGPDLDHLGANFVQNTLHTR